MNYDKNNPVTFLKRLEKNKNVQGMLDNTYVGKTFRDIFTNDFRSFIFNTEKLPARVSINFLIVAIQFYRKGPELFKFDYDGLLELQNEGISNPLGFFVALLEKNKLEEELAFNMSSDLGTMSNYNSCLFAIDYKDCNSSVKKDFVEETIYQMFYKLVDTNWFKKISKLKKKYEMITKVLNDDFDLMMDLTAALYSFICKGTINELFFSNPPLKEKRSDLVEDFLLEVKFYFENNNNLDLY